MYYREATLNKEKKMSSILPFRLRSLPLAVV
jgi:hypothetical protein